MWFCWISSRVRARHQGHHLQQRAWEQCDSALNWTIQATVHSAKAGPRLFKQAIPHPAPCQHTTNSLQSGSLCSLECVCAEASPCHIPTSKSPGSSDSSSQHTALFLLRSQLRCSELHRVRGMKGCQSVWLCWACGGDSFWLRTDRPLCTSHCCWPFKSP